MAANEQFLTILERRRPDIEKMLAEWVTPERFFQMAMQVRRNPELAKCSDESLIECVVQAAQMGLELGGQKGHIYVIPYGNVAQAQPGWRGLAFLKMRAGAILSVDTDVVFEGDTFRVGRSSNGDVFEHIMNFKSDRTEKSAYAAYARVKLPDGEYEFEVTSRERIQRHRSHSKQPNGLLWTKFWEEGWRKTPYRILDKRLPEGVNKDAIERYNRAVATETRWEAPTEEVPDNTPEPSEAVNPRVETITLKGGGGTMGAGGVVVPPNDADASGPEPTLTQDQQDDLIQFARDNNKSLMVLARFIKASTGCDDLSQIKRSQLQGLQEKMAAEWSA